MLRTCFVMSLIALGAFVARADPDAGNAAPVASDWMLESGATLNAGDHARAREIMESAAATGDAEAINGLAQYAEMGVGGEPDPVLARKLYEQAVRGRSIGGALNLGRLLLDSDDATERCRGADLLQRIYSVPKSLETGVKRVAAAGLAYAYLLGRGVETDVAKGVALLEEADFKQDTDSHTLYLLGRTYESGWGGHAPDAKRAYDYYRRASELDNPKAWWSLGMAFLNGSGVEADPVEAYRWVRMAGEADDARGESSTAAMLALGQGVAENDVEARSWYERAAIKGSAHALRGLGFMLLNGEGGERDAGLGWAYVTLAAEVGDENAQLLMRQHEGDVSHKEKRAARKIAADWVARNGKPSIDD